MNPAPIRVVLFAHNEEDAITRSLDSIRQNIPRGSNWRVFVLINGCTDRTLERVLCYSQHCPEVTSVLIPAGDKCHAFNIYVHHLADNSPYHFFMDGDVEVAPGSLAAMLGRLADDATVSVVAGMPLSGRNCEEYAKMVRDWRYIFGNLYLVRHDNIARLRRHQIRLPIGLRFNDHFVTKMMGASSIQPYRWDPKSIGYVEGAGYRFRSLSPFRRADWRIYSDRLVRYRLGRKQIAALDALSLEQLPRTVDAVNQQILAEFNTISIPLYDWVGRRLRRYLHQRYPTPEATWFADRFNNEAFEHIKGMPPLTTQAKPHIVRAASL